MQIHHLSIRICISDRSDKLQETRLNWPSDVRRQTQCGGWMGRRSWSLDPLWNAGDAVSINVTARRYPRDARSGSTTVIDNNTVTDCDQDTYFRRCFLTSMTRVTAGRGSSHWLYAVHRPTGPCSFNESRSRRSLLWLKRSFLRYFCPQGPLK